MFVFLHKSITSFGNFYCLQKNDKTFFHFLFPLLKFHFLKSINWCILRCEMKWLFSFIIFSFLSLSLCAQTPNQESVYKKDYEAKKMFQVMAQYSYLSPNGDWARRYGVISSLGLGLGYKTLSNYTFNGHYNTLFGNRINETNMFDSLRGTSQELIDANGNYAIINYASRGAQVTFKFGKIIQLGQNANNGLWLQAGYSYLRHFVKFEYQEDILPQIDGEMLKGYDRLTAGNGFIGSIGYHHISANNTVSYFISYNLSFHITRSLRGYNYTTRTFENQKRNDNLSTLSLGIILPIKPKSVNQESLYK